MWHAEAAAQCAGLPLTLPGLQRTALERWRETAARAAAHPVTRAEFRAEALARLHSEQQIEAAIREVDFSLSNGALMLLPEYGHKLRVLKRLAFVSPDDVRRPALSAPAASACAVCRDASACRTHRERQVTIRRGLCSWW